VIVLMKMVLPMVFGKLYRIEKWKLNSEIFLLLLIWIFTSVAYSFFLAYVGRVPMTMYLAFKIVLICLVPPAMTMLIDGLQNARKQLRETEGRIRELTERTVREEEISSNIVELVSDSRAERLRLESADLIMIRSAENYVEVIYRDMESVQKKLLRTTMKSIEDQLRPFPQMIRCHRTCIVNTDYVIKLQRSAGGPRLKIHDYDEEIPVSRQYLLSVNAALGGDY
jgi:DNA-binding LytR/AlgR family response regulator